MNAGIHQNWFENTKRILGGMLLCPAFICETTESLLKNY